MKLILISLVSFNVSAATAVDSFLGKVVDSCDNKKSVSSIILIKQWHPAPQVNTKIDTKEIPQQKNQTAIYTMLDKWLKNKKIDTVIAEGCSGEIGEKTEMNINGWDYQSLKNELKIKNYSTIVTSVPLKLEVKYDKKVNTLCGDDLEEIKKNNLAMSELRAATGFLSRILEYKDKPQLKKSFIEGAVSTYKMKTDSTEEQITIHLKSEARNALKLFNELIQKRNEKVFDVVKKNDKAKIAIVFGGIHIEGLKKLFNDAKYSCDIIEPVGYVENEKELMTNLDNLLK